MATPSTATASKIAHTAMQYAGPTGKDTLMPRSFTSTLWIITSAQIKSAYFVQKKCETRHTEIGTNLHSMITHSNQTPPTRLHTVTIRQKDRKVFIDRLTRLLGYRSDGADPSSSNRETIDQASGRPMDTVIHRPRRPSQALINWLGFLGALVVWSIVGYLTVQYWMIANG